MPLRRLRRLVMADPADKPKKPGGAKAWRPAAMGDEGAAGLCD